MFYHFSREEFSYNLRILIQYIGAYNKKEKNNTAAEFWWHYLNLDGHFIKSVFEIYFIPIFICFHRRM